MTEEQEEAIKYLKESILIYKNTIPKISESIETVLSMLKEKDIEIEYQKEKRNNQKAELAILNEKQKEMNKLINIVSSYKGMFKKQQKEMKKKDKQIDLMADFINDNTPYTKDTKELENEEGIRTVGFTIKYFERKCEE